MPNKLEKVKTDLEELAELINSESTTKKVKFLQQKVTKKNMCFTGANGSIWIHPTTTGYDVGLSGKDLTKDMYVYMCDLTGKEKHDKYGYPNDERQPKWEVNSFEDVKKAVYRYAGLDTEQNLNHFMPEEVVEPTTFIQGATKKITVNAYERNAQARRKCIAHYGYKCTVCNFDFEETYGSLGKSYIHVHHLVPLSEVKEAYIIDPIRDLVPVCANCHSIIHRKQKVITIDELKSLLNKP